MCTDVINGLGMTYECETSIPLHQRLPRALETKELVKVMHCNETDLRVGPRPLLSLTLRSDA